MGLFAVALRDRAYRLPQGHLAGLVASPATAAGPVFRARVDAAAPPGGPSAPSGGGQDDAPRAQQHDDLIFEAQALDGTPVELVSGDRVQVALGPVTDSWELTRPPTPHRLFAGPLVYTGEALRVSALYPLTGSLRELGGVAVAGAASVPVGLWRTAQAPAEAGEQYVYEAETPYEWLPYLDAAAHPNRELVVNGAAHRIVSAAPNQAAPRIVLTLRRVRGGG